MKRLIVLFICVSFVSPSWGAIALISGFPISVATTNGSSVSCESGVLDTTGATLIVMVRQNYADRAANDLPRYSSVSNFSNSIGTFVALTKAYNAGLSTLQIFYIDAPTTSATAYFRASDQLDSGYGTMWVYAFSGTASSPVRDESTNTASGSPTSIAPSVAVGANTDVIITGVSDNLNTGTSQSCGNSFTNLTAFGFVSGTHTSGNSAYKFATTSELPTWSSLGGSDAAVAIAAFKASGGGGATLPPMRQLLNVGK